MPYTLRPQQIVFEDAIRAAFARVRTVVAVAPTGFGKGVVLADLASKAAAKRRRVLVVTNRRQIVLQLQEHCYNAGLPAGIIMGNEYCDREASVQIASIATLKRRDYANVDEPGFILIDEAHREHDEYRRLTQERFPATPVLGLTATPVGPGGSRLAHFHEIVEPIKNSEVIAAGDLLRVDPYLAPSEPDMGGIDLRRASQDEIGQRVDACTVYADVFAEWEPYSHMQTMVVLPTRAVCNQFHRMCMSRGITAKVVDGTTEQAERRETFSDFQDSDCQMLLGVDVIREGLDLPIAQCLIDLQPTHQMRVYWQKLGRVKRPHNGQASAVVIDMAGNLWRHNLHPDDDPPWDEVTSDRTIEEVVDRKTGVRCPRCGSKDIYSIPDYGYKCEGCGNEWHAKRPWVCPACRQALGPQQKVIDGNCPNCGRKITTTPVRRIRMMDGTMRSVSSHEIRRRKKTKANREQAVWDKWRYIAHGWNKKNPGEPPKTLDFVRAMYRKEMGEHPPAKLKDCPESSISGDWKRAPGDVYPWMKR